MNKSLKILLPPTLQEWVEDQIDEGGFQTPSDYFRKLIQEERKRQARLKVEAKLQAALDSGKALPVNAATWEESEKRVLDRLAKAKKPQANGQNR